MGAGGPLGTKKGIGRLRSRLQFRSPVRTAGATGQHKVTGWANAGDPVWGEVEEILFAGSERTRHEQQVPEATHLVCVRGGPAVLHDWSILWGDRVLNVVKVAGSGSGVANELLLWCKEVPASTS